MTRIGFDNNNNPQICCKSCGKKLIFLKLSTIRVTIVLNMLLVEDVEASK